MHAEETSKVRGVSATRRSASEGLLSRKSKLPTLRIFISHKSKDKKAVMLLKRTIESRCVRLHVFASCDAEKLRAGVEWSRKIHSELDRADWLVLLYTTPNENWDWCIYEAGYFAGRRGAGRTRTLAVMHPPGVVIPPPLQKWQAITAEPEKLRAFFDAIFKPKSPFCHWTGSLAELEQTADYISEAISTLGGNSHQPNQCMTIEVPATASRSGGNDLPVKTRVVLSPQMANSLGLVPNVCYAWSKFSTAARKFHFDIPALVKAVSNARIQQAVPSSLEQFWAPDGLAYRPIFFSVDWQRSGAVTLKLVFWALPRTSNPLISNHFERVRRLFNVATRFRRRIGEQFGNEAAKYADENSKQRKRFLRRVLSEIDEISAQAETEGLSDRDSTLYAFDEPAKSEILRMFGTWEAAVRELRQAIRKRKCDPPAKLLLPLRAMNRDFLLLSAQRLHELVSRFQIPTDVVEQPPQLGVSALNLPTQLSQTPAPGNGANDRFPDAAYVDRLPTPAGAAIADKGTSRKRHPENRNRERSMRHRELGAKAGLTRQ